MKDDVCFNAPIGEQYNESNRSSLMVKFDCVKKVSKSQWLILCHYQQSKHEDLKRRSHVDGDSLTQILAPGDWMRVSSPRVFIGPVMAT
jgi:hypothetical protein